MSGWRKGGVALVLALALGACEGMMGPGEAVTSDLALAMSDGGAADLALGALAKGEYGRAEIYVTRALQRDRRDPYGLVAAALLYQNTGREVEAVRAYQALLALHPTQTAAVGTWFRQRPESIAEIATANLEILGMLPETAGVVQGSGTDAMRQTPAGGAAVEMAMVPPPEEVARPPGMPAASGPARLTSEEQAAQAGMGRAGMHHAAMDGAPLAPLPASPEASALEPSEIANVIDRFLGLQKALAESLITREEYARRRTANIGALLPVSQPVPAAGLGRPAPDPNDLIRRLTALGATLERGAMTPDQHAAERDAILEALLPLHPQHRAPVMSAPHSLTDGAAAVARVRTARRAGVISEAEEAREIAAVEASVRRSPGSPRPVVRPGVQARAAPVSATRSGPVTAERGALAVHLASYSSESNARQGWADLRARFPQLASLSMSLHRVNLAGKGVFHRLMAGPVTGPQGAALCRQVKAQGQYCSVTRP